MKTKALLVWLCLIITPFLLVGCRPIKEIRGQMFIVRKDRETLKLSMVKIDAVDAALVTNRVETINTQVAKKVKGLQTEIEDLKQELKEKTAKVWKDHKSELELWDLQISLDIQMYRDHDMHEHDMHEHIAARSNVQKQIDQQIGQMAAETSQEVEAVKENIKAALDPVNYFQEPWPVTVATVITDVDGRFSLKIPMIRKLFLAAHVSREVGTVTEHYCWLVPTTNQKDISLNNDNMLKFIDISQPSLSAPFSQ
jgi:hypothetical protein